ncbi:MAG: alpha/beta fold hydrolase [Candidatus Omnitrophica bacterium]|nr:alpha/beta fold hydrolase [Candidatus Omnitrophota bacterium]
MDAVPRTTETVRTADGVTISVDRYRQGDREAAVIICPGFFQSKDTPTFQRLSRTLLNGHDVIAMDFRGHGRSSGCYTFTALEGADLEAVLGWARARYQFLHVLGFSLGGAIAINTVGRSPEGVRSLVAVSAPSDFDEIEFKFWTPEAMRTGLEGLEPWAGCRPGNLWLPKERAIENVPKLAPIPLLFIHGTRDVIVGVQHSHRLYAAAGEPKRLALIESGSHAEALFRDDPDGFTSLVRG